MSKPTVLITDKFTLRAQTLLEASCSIVKSQTPSCAHEDLSQVEALVIRSRTKIDKNLLARAPKLKFIVTATSGFDHIDLIATETRGIKVAFSPEANAASAAELTWALVLACARQTVDGHTAVKNETWNTHLRDGIQLCGHTYGVIGLGRIGTRVARIAQAFGMSVVGYDPYADESAFAVAQRVGLEELLKMSDVVSLHVPYTRETRKMINRSTLEYTQRDAILVNTSRGEILDEQELYEALKKGWLKGVGLDVFVKEPLPSDSNLLKNDRVVFSPHVGARTEDAYANASLEAAKQVLEFFTTGNVTHPLPPKALWYASPKGFN